ncbi:unnamed protein product [Vitrella brassicaformis CCMP3155]|uniref:DNA-directed RNA polymerase III subunit RPC4 n=1 Tax=Vitrella brassicaformis (strain CCMP3155) TaxID=1169540 RepID=A0A0G4FSZ7_VITBC|nr:unnamed protein product [Vitrella brassicaformis CCMP3155]|eukprot:CEM17792.1 unnamed protein product [Vitrella brassicaformis CCMP3155]
MSGPRRQSGKGQRTEDAAPVSTRRFLSSGFLMGGPQPQAQASAAASASAAGQPSPAGPATAPPAPSSRPFASPTLAVDGPAGRLSSINESPAAPGMVTGISSSSAPAHRSKVFAPNVRLQRQRVDPAAVEQQQATGTLPSAIAALREASRQTAAMQMQQRTAAERKDAARGKQKRGEGRAAEERDEQRDRARAAHLQYYRQKRSKGQQQQGKSKDLMDLSWAEAGGEFSVYAPTTLPFVVREDEDGQDHQQHHQQQGERDATDKSDGEKPVSRASADEPRVSAKRPTVKHVDEVNRNAAVLFNRDAEMDAMLPPAYGGSDDRDFFIMQFPNRLPAIDRDRSTAGRAATQPPTSADSDELQQQQQDGAEEDKRPAADASSRKGGRKKEESKLQPPPAYMSSSIDQLPEGKLGKLLIYKSGRVKLQLGDHLFNIDQGSECQFAQDVGCVVGSSELTFLGPVQKRMVITPDIETAFANMGMDNNATKGGME